MKSEHIGIILGAGLVASCSYTPSTYESVDVNIVQKAIVSEDRQSVEFIVSNLMKYDVVCNSHQLRVVFDNPRSYLDVGEFVMSVSGMYINALEEKRFGVPTTAIASESEIEVQYASSFSPGEKCRWAEVEDYCSRVDEAFARLSIPEVQEDEDCFTFSSRLEQGKVVRKGEKMSQGLRDFSQRFFRYRSDLQAGNDEGSGS